MPEPITDMAVTDDTTAPVPADTALTKPPFVASTDEPPPERLTGVETWPFALSTDPVPVEDAGAALDALVASYRAAVDPSGEVVDLLNVAVSAATDMADAMIGTVVIRIGGRATPGHRNVAGTDESVTITVSVIEVTPVEENPEVVDPVAIEGGTFTPVE